MDWKTTSVASAQHVVWLMHAHQSCKWQAASFSSLRHIASCPRASSRRLLRLCCCRLPFALLAFSMPSVQALSGFGMTFSANTISEGAFRKLFLREVLNPLDCQKCKKLALISVGDQKLGGGSSTFASSGRHLRWNSTFALGAAQISPFFPHEWRLFVQKWASSSYFSRVVTPLLGVMTPVTY